MKRPDLSGVSHRKSSTFHYETLPIRPPKSRGRPPFVSPSSSGNGDEGLPRLSEDELSGLHHETALPVKQLVALAVIALAEQTALNSISPYLPDMVASFPGVDATRVGLDVGTIASCFALAQFATGFLWGWLSDRIGRKPVILTGTILTAACFVAFGFCRTFWQAALVQALMGLVNGNQGVVPTCLGDITDRSNQSRAFTYLPVLYGLGAITGPVLGGLSVSKADLEGKYHSAYPYLWPNLLSAIILMVDLVITMIFLEESLEEAQDLPPLGKRIRSLFAWVWQFSISTRPSYLRLGSPAHRGHNRHGHDQDHHHPRWSSDNLTTRDLEREGDDESDQASDVAMPTLFPHVSELDSKQVITRDIILLLITYLIFQLCNVSFNSLYPIFASSQPPTGRDLSPREIGLSLSFAGVVTIIFQLGVFGKFQESFGNRGTYRATFAGFALAFLVMPWVGYKDSVSAIPLSRGQLLLWVEIALVLMVKTIAAVGGLTSALLLVYYPFLLYVMGLRLTYDRIIDYQLSTKP